jgi:hypothetical protein
MMVSRIPSLDLYRKVPLSSFLLFWLFTDLATNILVNKRAGSLSSLGLVGLIDSIELSWKGELAKRAELTT